MAVESRVSTSFECLSESPVKRLNFTLVDGWGTGVCGRKELGRGEAERIEKERKCRPEDEEDGERKKGKALEKPRNLRSKMERRRRGGPESLLEDHRCRPPLRG